MNKLQSKLLKRIGTKTRFASTVTNPKTFLPSVSLLIERNNLTADIVSKIPTTGPKNNLLKGDVLKFLQEGGSLKNIDEILGCENYYQLDLKALGNEWMLALKKSIDSVDVGELYKNLASAECTVTKISKNNEVSRTVDLASNTTTTKPFDGRIRSGSFRFVDCLALGPLEEAPSFHTTSGEAAVLSIYQLGSFASENDLDFLVGSSPSAAHFFKPQEKLVSHDLIDYLTSTTNTPNSVRLELTVDGTIVNEKIATQFLRQIKDLVDEHQ